MRRKKELHNVGTTCLFGAVCNEKLYIGQAGDGVCCVKLDGKFKMTAQKDNDLSFIAFCNTVNKS